MGRFLIRRLLVSIVTLVLISILVFSILAIAPGDPLSGFANNPSVPPELRQQLRHQLGIDDPITVQYSKWARQYVRGNWGVSYVSRSPVSNVIFGGKKTFFSFSFFTKTRLGTTTLVGGLAFFLSLLIAIPIGVISALKQYSVFDQAATTVAFLGFSVPTFFSGLVLIIIFSVKLGWLPFIYDSTTSGFWPWVKQLIMPVFVLGFFGAASTMRFTRASMLEIISQDYIRTARAKGLSEGTVTTRHAMRNAMIPVVTIVALQIPAIFGGAVITEQIFRIPGIGSLLISSIQSKDVPVVMAITFGIAILIVLFNIVADILYAVLDPRVKLS